MKDTEKAYIAGIIDGEGSISLFRRNQYKTNGHLCNFVEPSFQISNTKKELIEWLKKKVRGRISINTYKNKSYKDCYVLKISTPEQISDILNETIPFLIIRKEQAKLMLEFCKLRKTNKRKKHTVIEFEMAEKMKALNLRGI